MNETASYKAVLLLILLTLIWGTSFILIKQGLVALPADQVGSLRVTAAAIFLLPVALTRFRELTRKNLMMLFAAGGMGILIPPFLFAAAQTHMDSSVAGVLNTLSPVWTMIWGAMLFHQKFRGLAIVGVLLAFAGAVVLAASRSTLDFSGINVYALLIVLACALYGANLNFIKYKFVGMSSLTISSVSVVLVGIVAATYLFGFTDFTSRLSSTPGAWRSTGYVVLLGVMGTSVATMLFNKLVKISSPMFASSVTYLMPVVSVGWGLLDHEQLYAGHYAGMAAILAGVYLVNRK